LINRTNWCMPLIVYEPTRQR